MSSDRGYQRRRRAPGAEHPIVKARRRAVNPDRLQRLTQAEVDTVVTAAVDRAIADTVYHQPTEQQSPPGRSPEDRKA